MNERPFFTLGDARPFTVPSTKGGGFAERGFRPIATVMSDARDTGFTLDPRYDAQGLITAVVTDDGSGEVLMLAHMNAQALQLTVETGLAHFWSRSRQALWKKGETSGNMLEVRDIRIDCDQDAVWIKAVAKGPACHTGARSCFFRRIGPDGLTPVDAGGNAAD